MGNHTQGEVKVTKTTDRCWLTAVVKPLDGFTRKYIQLLGMKPDFSCATEKALSKEEREANIERIAVLWNAADGKSNEDAVKFLMHGGDILELNNKLITQNEDHEKNHELMMELIKILEKQNKERLELIRDCVEENPEVSIDTISRMNDIINLEDEEEQ
ncbi:MAG: hypothetical protein KAS32_30180 [Candidatus Peribacteraceae bacterium]|nr:hypothetical protein [Candidatus Peribacteraceae bacterium]